jgi:hypothetical protein
MPLESGAALLILQDFEEFQGSLTRPLFGLLRLDHPLLGDRLAVDNRDKPPP